MKKICKIKKEIEIRKRYISELRSKMDGVSGIDYTKDKLQGGPNSPDDRLVKLISKIIKHEKTVEELQNILDKIDDAINSIEDTEYRQILILRYLNGLSWKQTCEELYISFATAKRKHATALEELKKYLN